MKTIFLWVAAILILSGTAAQAERWVIKNPRASALALNPLKRIDLGGNSYLVVNPPAFVTDAELLTYGESVFPDAKVTLPKVFGEDEVEEAWHVTAMQYDKLPPQYDGRGVIVAVVDTGVDYTHSALADHVWINEKEIADNGLDDDGNGYIDDVRGWDFELNRNNVMDDNGHGTHCAGIVAASIHATSKAQGVAPGAKVMPIRVIGDKSIGFLSDVIAGVKYAVDNGARVLSNSWRIYKSWEDFEPSDENIELLKQAIVYADQHGAIFVAAAGNESVDLDADSATDPMFPGGYTGLANLIVVAASDARGEPAYFTNYGPGHVSVAAPGVSILSTVPGEEWASLSGTSMATPLIAGAVARGLSAGYDAHQIDERLMGSSATATTWETKIRAKGVVDLLRYLNP